MKNILFTGRVAKIKCLDNLVKAMASCKEGWKLRIVGPDQEGHTAELKVLTKNLGIEDQVEFVGPKFDEELTKEYAQADCFVLPSHSENFGSVVLEALAVGTPVIASTGTPWKILEDSGCGLWVDNDPVTLSQALEKMMTKSSEERAEMGARGRKLVEEKYTWSAVAKTLEQAYKSL